MKKRIGLVTAIIAAVLVVGLLTWRFWPRSFFDSISVDENSITGFSAYAIVYRIENGQPQSDAYRIDDSAQQNIDPREVVEILAGSEYQQDFRNLLPLGVDSIGSDKNHDGRTVSLSLYLENAENEYIEIIFLSSSIMVVRTEEDRGVRVYHPTDSLILGDLVEYIQTYDVEQ